MVASSPSTKSASGKVKRNGEHRHEEPALAEFRIALFGRRHEWLRVTAFSLSLAFSVIFLVHREGLIAPDNQYAVDGAAALVALASQARAGADAVAGSAAGVADRAYGNVAAAVSGLGSLDLPAASPRVTRTALVAKSHPRHSLGARRGHQTQVMKVALRHKSAALAGRGSAAAAPQASYQGAAFDAFANWLVYEFPQDFRDECVKAYYGLLHFFVGEVELSYTPDIYSRAEGWIETFRGWLDPSAAGASFSLSGPLEMLRASSGVNAAIVAASGILMILMLLGLAGVRESYQRARRK